MALRDLLTALHVQNPLVDSITSYVAMCIAAIVILAAIGSPTMVPAIEGIGEITPVNGALAIDAGTLSIRGQADPQAAARAFTSFRSGSPV